MIFVVGAGWYGCHIASELLKAGFEVRIVDKANTFFAGSSARNQNRLHLGYHYPRSVATIYECRRGFQDFRRLYPNLSFPVPNNFYLLGSASKTSVTAFSERFLIGGEPLDKAMQKIPFGCPVYDVEPVAFQVTEEYIDNEGAAEAFRALLSPHFLHLPPTSFSSLEILKEVLGNEGMQEGDWIVNCTYNQLVPIPMESYELYCSLVYHIPGDLFAITVMDGDYFSIYPYDLEKRLYTVTSVRHGVVYRGPTLDCNMDEIDVGNVRSLVEAEVTAVFPTFPTHAYHSSFLSWKTKPVTNEDDRSLRFHQEGKCISLYGGKITGMFEAARRVLELVGS
jgi:hypothetical protein